MAATEQLFESRQGLESVEGIYETHIRPAPGDKAWPEITTADIERVRDALDDKVEAGKTSAKTAFNAWTRSPRQALHGQAPY